MLEEIQTVEQLNDALVRLVNQEWSTLEVPISVLRQWYAKGYDQGYHDAKYSKRV